MSGAVQVDAQSEHQVSPSSGVQRQVFQASGPRRDVLTVGIFSADCDTAISNRLAEKLKQHEECEVKIFDLLVGGKAKMETLHEFISSSDTIIWVATRTSLDDESLLKAARQISQHTCICRNEVTFVIFKPSDFLSLKLPLDLDAYAPLLEDEQFDIRVTKSLKSWVKQKKKREKCQQDRSAAALQTTQRGPTTEPISDTFQDRDSVRAETRVTSVEQYAENVAVGNAAEPDGAVEPSIGDRDIPPTLRSVGPVTIVNNITITDSTGIKINMHIPDSGPS